MRRVILVLIAFLVVACVACGAEARYGTTTYHLRGVTYFVPHKYEFSRQFHLPWLDEIEGLAEEPAESIWLMIPAPELASGIPGYQRNFAGAVGPVEGTMVVNIRSDPNAREFVRLRQRNWENVEARLADGAELRPDPSGMVRLVHSEGPPEDGNRSFYLFPNKAAVRSQGAQIAPSCLANLDYRREERYACSYVIHRDGLTYDFSLHQHSINVADRVPDYLLRRLSAWRK
jgi:hypothetical protein